MNVTVRHIDERGMDVSPYSSEVEWIRLTAHLEDERVISIQFNKRASGYELGGRLINFGNEIAKVTEG